MFMPQFLCPHTVAVIDDACGKTDHQPIEPKQKHDDGGKRAVKPRGVCKSQIHGKRGGGNQPRDRGIQTTEHRV